MADGIWWSTNKGYKNAIANELFFATAAKLGKKEWAAKIWKWFSSSGMINNQSLINDGLGKDCRNNGRNTYTYNQGVVLGVISLEFTPLNAQIFLHFSRHLNRRWSLVPAQHDG